MKRLSRRKRRGRSVLIWSTTTTGWWKSTVQHFTGARGATFEHYPPPSAVLGFSPSE
ncbi:MAG: hypothetical protein R2713_24225 [Ilumatobacteraceae bacterium]